MSYSNNPFLSPAPPPPPKRKVFISYYGGDQGEVDDFIYQWETVHKVFTAKALGTFDNDDFINSNNTEYVMSEIRRKYIGDASVTIVLIGKCTHSRRYVDWEIKASLTRGQSLPNGLLAFVLPSAMPPAFTLLGTPIDWERRAWPNVPERLAANWKYGQTNQCYAHYYVPPDSPESMRQFIEAAFWDRTNRAGLIVNPQDMMKNNAFCKVHGVTH